MKTCTVCKATKPLDEFHLSAKSRDGRQSRCKPCANAAAREWNKANRERKNESGRKWREAKADEINAKRRTRRAAAPEKYRQQKMDSYYRNRDATLVRQREYAARPESKRRARERCAEWAKRNPRGATDAHRLRFYGLTPEQFDEMVEEQAGTCAICGQEPSDGKAFNVDHDHETGLVRALLCGNCNRGLGSFADDPERLRSAAAYLDFWRLAHLAGRRMTR